MPSITGSTARSTGPTTERPTPWPETSRTASRSAAGAADAGRPRAAEAAKAAGRESDSGRSDSGSGVGRASAGTHGLVICAKSVRDTAEGSVDAGMSAADALGLRFPSSDLVAAAAALFEPAEPWAHGRDRLGVELLTCPCGILCSAVYDRRRRRWRHLDLGRCRLWLVYEIRRVECPNCGVRTGELPWARPGARHTHDFEHMVLWLAQRTDRTSVATLMRCGWETVTAIINRGVAELFDMRRPLPQQNPPLTSTKAPTKTRGAPHLFVASRRCSRLTVAMRRRCCSTTWTTADQRLSSITPMALARPRPPLKDPLALTLERLPPHCQERAGGVTRHDNRAFGL